MAAGDEEVVDGLSVLAEVLLEAEEMVYLRGEEVTLEVE